MFIMVKKVQYSIYIITALCLLSSCVTNKDLEYLYTQNDKLEINFYDYIIQKEDLLSVQISSTTKQDHDFFNLQETSNPQLMAQNPYLYGYLVKPDGIVTLPMIGDIKVDGFTVSEVEKVIEQIASTHFTDPIVKVNVLNFNVTILGEVNSPGRYNIVRSNQNIFHLIGEANDLTEFANRKRIKIIRNSINEDAKIILLDLTDPNVLVDKDMYLQPQDIVYVEPMQKKFYSVRNLSSAVSIGVSAFTLYLLITNNN